MLLSISHMVPWFQPPLGPSHKPLLDRSCLLFLERVTMNISKGIAGPALAR